MQLPHRLALGRSRLLASTLVLLILATLTSVVLLPLAPWIKLFIAIPVGISVLVSLYRHALLLDKAAAKSLLLKADGSAEVMLADGYCFEARVSPRSTLFPWLMVLQLDRMDSAQARSLLVLPDMLPQEDLRILRCWLLWKTI